MVAKQEREKEKEKKRSAAGKVLLSFGDDEEAHGPLDGKKTERLKASGVRATAVALKATATQVSGPGEYSAERLKELQKNTVQLPASKKPEKPASESIFKLSGSFKSAAAPKDDRFETSVHVIQSTEEEEEMPPPPPRPSSAANGSAAKSLQQPSAAALAALDDEEDDAFIPDADTIRRAKEKRERLRSAHLAPDYLPLGGASALMSKGGQEKDSAAAAVAESDSEEEAEEQMRISFLGDVKKGGKASNGVLAGVADDQVHQGDEEDEDDWAREQLRKGVGLPADQMPSTSGRGGAAGNGRVPGPASALTARPQTEAVAAAGEEVLKALRQGLARLQASQTGAEKQLARTSVSLQNSMAAVTTLENDLSASGEKFTFLQDMRAYIADLCDMLQHKSALVEELEDRMLEAREQRARSAVERSAADEEDEEVPAAAAVSAAMGVLGRGGSPIAAGAAAESAAGQAEGDVAGTSGPAELDEFGRDVNLMKRKEAEARTARRRQRAQTELERFDRDKGGAEPRWGEDTTDESEGEVAHYSGRRREILDSAATVFADAAEEFASLPALKARLEAWKASHGSTYRDAYMSLSAAAVFAPFVRAELLQWDPLFTGPVGFDSQQWYEQLFDYGMAASMGPGDADEELVPKLVRELVLPLGHHALRSVWNPASKRQTRAAAALLADLLVYVPADDAKMQDCLVEVRARLEDAVGQVRLPRWPRPAAEAWRPAAVLLARRFGKALRLLRAVAAFEGTLARGPLCTLAFDRLLPQVMPYLQTAAADVPVALDRAERVAAALPAPWFEAGPLKSASPLMEFLNGLARHLESQRADKRNAPLAQRLAQTLAKLGDTGRADRLSAMFKQ
ncbi:g2948 [Coccomyxa elongata]